MKRPRFAAGDAICADTNILVRAAAGDDPIQSAQAREVLAGASSIVVTTTSLCEFVWVLQRAYRFDRTAIAEALRALLDTPTVRTDRDIAAAGLRQLERGGDFADGVIAHAGIRLGAARLVTFDRRASELWRQDGIDVVLLDSA